MILQWQKMTLFYEAKLLWFLLIIPSKIGDCNEMVFFICSFIEILFNFWAVVQNQKSPIFYVLKITRNIHKSLKKIAKINFS